MKAKGVPQGVPVIEHCAMCDEPVNGNAVKINFGVQGGYRLIHPGCFNCEKCGRSGEKVKVNALRETGQIISRGFRLICTDCLKKEAAGNCFKCGKALTKGTAKVATGLAGTIEKELYGSQSVYCQTCAA